MPKQVTIHKVVTALLPDIDIPLEEIEPAEIWKLIDQVGKVVRTESEFLGSSDADLSCPECLASLQVLVSNGTIKIFEGQMEFEDIQGIEMSCSENADHKIPESYAEKVRLGLNQKTSE
jgi:hypothetical protein